MPSERRQFGLLHRDFLFRMIDLELLSTRGDIQKLLGQFAALLGAFSFVLAVLLLPRYAGSRLSERQLAVAAWGDEEFLIATTIAIVGVFAVIAWNAVLPDRRDSLVLGPLPIRVRTIFAAKVVAMLTGLGVAVLAGNAFIGISYPLFLGGARSLAAYWLAMAAAGLFVFCSLLAVQGIAAQLLSYRLFLRVSGFLQLLAFFAILSLYFLTPPLATPHRLAAPENQRLLAWLPSFWFLGLFQELHGNADPVFGPLAARALRNLSVVLLSAGATYALMYFRQLRRIVEQPDIAPGDRRPAIRIGTSAARALAKPLDRAILLFTARTLARSRQHRFLLAAFGGMGLAVAFACAKELIYSSGAGHWNRVTLPGLTVSLVLLTFAIVGARAVFALPVVLPANWIFRITAVQRPAAYCAAVRKSLLALAAAPVWIGWALAYFALWPGRFALEHALVLAITAMLLVDLSLHQFHKIPFACSYLPGAANLKVKLGLYAGGFFLAVSAGTALEFVAMQKLARFAVFVVVLWGITLWAWQRRAEFANARHNRLQFEDAPIDDVLTLDIGGDSASFSEELYPDTEELPNTRRRWKLLTLALLGMLACGLVYERVGQWQDRRRFPQLGRSVNIGGRSLNIYCSGSGGPAVVFDAAHGAPGYTWLAVQREIARNTRACWYDRAGFGWSDPTPRVNTVPNMAEDLHALLRAAEIPPPYILVGASLGGFNIRVFRSVHPDEVAGMVFVDASHEDTLKWIPNMPSQRPPEILRRPAVFVASTLGLIGVLRLFAADPASAPLPPGFTREESEVLAALGSQPKTTAAEINEAGGGLLRVNRDALSASRGLGDLPVIVLTAGRGPDLDQQQLWIKLQRTLAWQSARGRQVVLEDSTHMIQFEDPGAVVDAVREVLAETRK